MKRLSLTLFVALTVALVPATSGAGNICQEGFCPSEVINETACTSTGAFVGALGFSLNVSDSRQAPGVASQQQDLLAVGPVAGLSAIAIETSCESSHSHPGEMQSCGTTRIVGLDLATGVVDLTADELVIRACSGYGENAENGVDATFVGLQIQSPFAAALNDPITDNTIIQVGNVATLFLDETQSNMGLECRSHQGTSLRLESSLTGTIIIGAVATNACTVLPQ